MTIKVPSTLADELEPIITAALEPAPTPLPEQDSRVGEAMAGQVDIRNNAYWRERVGRARLELAERGPAILTALRASPVIDREAQDSLQNQAESAKTGGPE